MKIEERNVGSAFVVSPAGRLDGNGAPVLEARFVDVAGHAGDAWCWIAAGSPTSAAQGCAQFSSARRPACRKESISSSPHSGPNAVRSWKRAACCRLSTIAGQSGRRWPPARPEQTGHAGRRLPVGDRGTAERAGGRAAVERPAGRRRRAGPDGEDFRRPGARGVRLVVDCADMSFVSSVGLRARCRDQGLPGGGREVRPRRAPAAMPLGPGDERLPFGHRLPGDARGRPRRAC